MTDSRIRDLIASTKPRTGDSGDGKFPANDTSVVLPMEQKLAEYFDENIAEFFEALTLELVHRETTIPVPRVRRVIPYTPTPFYIAMDHIPGRSLWEAWPSLPGKRSALR